MAKCPNTRLTIPECSCSRCLEEQVRRVAPSLLDKESGATPGSDFPSSNPRRQARLS
jgi:hypothetical protein